ncbi:hypothetical protein [Alicyclobacillus vulcanalis]|uniref:Uncharacterized protein n=1 Tax=Alicyclobacillus vulcanalis TaxID=252246 RepID=A0A1N7NI70_9BACL|nr:hypothetical protein [Alicyclobacillus vulcanalis]SIS98123.1 hypothetical protein SAMN05421799_108156 [Alicyclobacillus vulcanalis]
MTSAWALLWAIFGAVVDFRRWTPKSRQAWLTWLFMTGLAIGVAIATDFHMGPSFRPLHVFDVFSGLSSWLYGGSVGIEEA